LTTSFLAKEGIENSGSYMFADHIYAQSPKGRFLIGQILDNFLLHLPSATAMRFRYLKVKKELKKLIKNNPDKELHILYVPTGVGREFFEIDEEIGHELKSPKKIHLHGLDLDEELVSRMKEKSKNTHMNVSFNQGDAFQKKNYTRKYDMIISTGFVDFLKKEEAETFFDYVYSALKPGGIFLTSGMMPYRLSEYLMRQFAELRTSYRSEDDLIALAEKGGFLSHEIEQDEHKLQTVIMAKT
jgi:2-polyprenyl-3-methyl-5-hydroxy-6-metoxy-1,4-benzoquinol methylase